MIQEMGWVGANTDPPNASVERRLYCVTDTKSLKTRRYAFVFAS